MAGEYKSLQIAGFTKSGEVDIKYNYQTDDPILKDKKPIIRLIPSGLKGVTQFAEVKYIDVGPGMSGGPLLDDKGNVLGITTRYMPFEDTPWIIPIMDVEAFIEDKKIMTGKNPALFNLAQYKISAKPFITGDSLPKKPGDSLPKKPGDSLPKKPGDSLPKKPGDSLPKKPSDSDDVLALFQDKAEGIVDFNDPQKRKLLAVRCSSLTSWEQIDGNDDYIHKCPDVTKLAESDKIYVDQDEEIPLEHRGKALDVLIGSFDYNNSSYSGRKITYVEDRSAIDQMKKIKSQLQRDEVVISPKSIKINLGKDKKLDFEIKADENGKLHLLDSTNNILDCDNKSITKLICQSSNISLTLSMVNTHKKELRYRVSIKNKDVTEYYYGSFINKEK